MSLVQHQYFNLETPTPYFPLHVVICWSYVIDGWLPQISSSPFFYLWKLKMMGLLQPKRKIKLRKWRIYEYVTNGALVCFHFVFILFVTLKKRYTHRVKMYVYQPIYSPDKKKSAVGTTYLV